MRHFQITQRMDSKDIGNDPPNSWTKAKCEWPSTGDVVTSATYTDIARARL
jgi:hypothetical protein